jgi:ribosomal protein S2
MTDDLVKRLRGYCDGNNDLMDAAADRIEELEAALRAIDNAIPKNDPTLPAICLIAGDIAEGALNGTWPAFGVMPRAVLGGKEPKNSDWDELEIERMHGYVRKKQND